MLLDTHLLASNEAQGTIPLLGMPTVNPDVDFSQLCAHVEAMLPEESPLVYGLHPNAQHALLTAQVCRPMP